LQARTGTRVLVVFDVLAIVGRDVRGEPYRDRRARLAELLEHAHDGLALIPATEDPAGAQAWMREHIGTGIEGVVAKRLGHTYAPGRRWWSKHRTRLSAEAIIGGVVGPLDAPRALILGRHDTRGKLRVVGRTIPLQRTASAEIARLLTMPRGPHPWPTVLPGGRFGLPGQDPVAHTPVDPAVVVELDVDTSFEAGRWRHGAKLRRVRYDLQPEDVT
jgi:ATP-dependent DNA ligase